MNDIVSPVSGPAVQGFPSGANASLSDISVDLTSELRWFFDGRLPDEVRTWFTFGEATGLAQDRCDAYRVDGQQDIGVKLRFRTVLELKIRQARPEFVFVGQDLEGWLEVWQRWSPADGRIDLTENENWVDVNKSVIKRRFGGDGQELPLSEENRAMTGQGCDAEVASISMEGRMAWTFALAAFGPADGHRSSLERAWATIESGRLLPEGLQLDGTNSCGYPKWISW